MAHTPELEKLERRYDDDPAKWFAQLAEAYRKYERVDDALSILENHLADRPNYVSALIVLGRCHLDKKDDGQARGAFERVLAIDPENIIALKALGEVAERAGNTDEAREWLTRLIEIDPANDDAIAALERLGGAAAVDEVPAPAAPAPEASFGDVADAIEAEAAPEGEPMGFEPTTLEAPEPEAAAAPEDLPIERASMEMDMPTVEMAPIELEQAPAEALPEPAPAPEPVAEPAAEAPVEIGEVELEPFDDSLAWGTGERLSGQVSADDLAAAEAAHEPSMEDSAVEELPGLEGAEVPEPAGAHDVEAVEGLVDMKPPPDLEPAPGFEPTMIEMPEPEPGPEPEAEPAPAEAVEERGSLAGLPVILPEDEPVAMVEAGEEEEEGTEQEPVVTETMGDLYVQQGHVEQARAVYQQLLAQRPGDAKLQAKLDALKPAARAPKVNRFAAAETGGASVRTFLHAILDGQYAPQPAAAPAPPPAPPAMDEAFADEPMEPKGQPTRPGSAGYSLGTVFGEESPAPPASPPSGGGGGGAEKKSGFSFDEFFGGGPKKPTPRPSRGSEGADGDDDNFKAWLKGLKT